MIRWITLLLTGLLPCMVSAQTVTVRSGEHGDFTRLVLDVPDGTKWVLTPDPVASRVTLSLDAGPYSYDTSTVFNRIGTERIARLKPADDGRGLEIDLGCQCVAEAFVLRGTMLVVDIAPSDTSIQRTSEKPVSQQWSGQAVTPSPLLKEFSRIQFGDSPRIGPPSVENPLMTRLAQRQTLGMIPSVLDRQIDDLMFSRDLGDQLAENLAVAASRGLLDPAIRSRSTTAPNPKHHADRFIPEELSVDPGTLARRLAAGMSGLDRETLQDGRISVGGEICVPDQKLAVASWSPTDDDPRFVLADRRGQVFGEFDRISPERLSQYVKALLHFGFGAEARSVLSLQPEKQAPVLEALSYIIDGEADPAGLFDGLSNCDGAAALWSAVARPPRPDAPEIAHAAILRSFESLPKHLRSHLGPILVEHLSASGYPSTARDVLRRLQRMEGLETDSIALSKAQLALKDGMHAEAGRRLHDLSISGGPEAAKAVAAAVDLAEATDTPVPARIVELSEAFAHELRDNEDGADLWKAHVRSLLINGEYGAAFSEFGAASGMSPEIVGFMQQVALKFLVERGNDIAFLKFATRSLSDGVLPEQSGLSIAIAERFLNLGLPEATLSQLDVMADANDLPEARIVRAEALLRLYRPEEAEIILIGQRGDRVVQLRAEARRQMGDHVFAKSIFEGIGEDGAAVTSAWLSGDWKDVAESDSVFAPAAELMQSTPIAFDVADVSLAAADDLSAASARSLETLRALLDATAVPARD